MRVPERGDMVWLVFDPQAGRAQAGRRPAVILSPKGYNGKVGLALCYPVTNRAKGYPFEVPIPAGKGITGVVLADHVRSVDWKGRQATFIAQLPAAPWNETLDRAAEGLSAACPA
jgi:mRNA interferase MazF